MCRLFTHKLGRMQYTFSRGCVMADRSSHTPLSQSHSPTTHHSPDAFHCLSRLGPREREDHDLALTEACDVDLVAVHEDCTDHISQIDANLLQDVA